MNAREKTLATICKEWDISEVAVSSADRRNPIEIRNVSREDDLPLLFKACGFRVGAEIGVQEGLYAETLCYHVPGLKLYGVDLWERYSGYRDHVSQEKLDGFYAQTCERMKPYNWIEKRGWSHEVAKQFDDGSLDFVYIDANHGYADVVRDLHSWSPKVRKGGIIAGHDFVKRKPPISHHVVQAVQGWTDSYAIAPWFLLGLKAKLPHLKRDDNRTYMWVR